MGWEKKTITRLQHPRDPKSARELDVEALTIPGADGAPVAAVMVVPCGTGWVVEASHGAPHGAGSTALPPFGALADAKAHAYRFALSLVEKTISDLNEVVLNPLVGGRAGAASLRYVELAPEALTQWRHARTFLEDLARSATPARKAVDPLR